MERSFTTLQNDYTETEHTAGFIHSMAFNKDGSQLAVAFGEVAKVALFDTSRGFGKSLFGHAHVDDLG